MEGLVVTKLLAILTLLVCSLIASFLPYKLAGVLKRWDERHREKEKLNRTGAHSNHHVHAQYKNVPISERIISMMICFSGGVLLAVAIVHMLPEVRKDILRAMDNGSIIETDLPVAEMVFCCGFLAVYFVERVVRFLVKRKDDKDLERITIAIQPSVLPYGTSDAGRVYNASSPTVVAVEAKHGSVNADIEVVKSVLDDDNMGKRLGHLFIILALSFHSIFEGLAIGLQDDLQDVWLLFIGVGAHKFLIAFCIGMELFTSGQQSFKMASGYLITFAIMSPIGIGIGLGVTEEISDEPGVQAAVVGILQGLAAGTLLYVTFFELLNEQSEKVQSMPAVYSFMEWATFAAGFLAMTLINSLGAMTSTANTLVDPTPASATIAF